MIPPSLWENHLVLHLCLSISTKNIVRYFFIKSDTDLSLILINHRPAPSILGFLPCLSFWTDKGPTHSFLEDIWSGGKVWCCFQTEKSTDRDRNFNFRIKSRSYHIDWNNWFCPFICLQALAPNLVERWACQERRQRLLDIFLKINFIKSLGSIFLLEETSLVWSNVSVSLSPNAGVLLTGRFDVDALRDPHASLILTIIEKKHKNLTGELEPLLVLESTRLTGKRAFWSPSISLINTMYSTIFGKTRHFLELFPGLHSMEVAACPWAENR